MEKLEPDIQLKFLDVAALQAIFGVGRSKARLMMDALQGLHQSEGPKRLPHRQWRYPHQLAQTPTLKISARFFS